MKYEKPLVALLAAAARAIQSGSKLIQIVLESDPSNPSFSSGAYEADE